MTKILRVLTSSILIALAPLAAAQTTTTTTTTVDTQANLLDSTAMNRGQTQVATQIASNFTNLAGSTDNALALVRSLRNGTQVTLTTSTTGAGTGTTTTSISFTPPTGKMGWGNVFISLALAQNVLVRAGITQPTAEQLQAALLGGDITGADGKTVTLKGILQMRADGMGWGQIAQALGTKLGPVVSAIKSTQVKVAKLPATTTSANTKSATASSKGVTTAEGAASASSKGKGPDKGLTTATGSASSSSSRGLVTATGTSGSGSNAPGRGIVTGSGGSGANVGASMSGGQGRGAGVINATGGSVSTTVTNAQGNSGGNGNDHGKGKGGG